MTTSEPHLVDAPAPAAPEATVSVTFPWSWQDTPISLDYEVFGAEGGPTLLLPAMSTVSCRAEMAPLARLLSARTRAVAVDWPGFGDAPRPALRYTPELYRGYLDDFVAHLRERYRTEQIDAVAAGHAGGYALDLEARRPGTFSRLALIAPTWRGPLPTFMDGRKPVQERIRKVVYLPGIGQLLYRLNTIRPIVRSMYRGHVLAGDEMLTPAFLEAKLRVAHQPNARFASASFVTGTIDPMPDREAFLAAARAVQAPVLLIYGEDTPTRSRAEMDALAELPNVEAHVLGRGALGMHEELPGNIAPLIEAFRARH